MNKLATIAAALTVAIATPPAAQAYMSGHVTNVIVEYLPGGVCWQMDVNGANCPAGDWVCVGWNGYDQDRIAALFITLLTARISGFYLAVGSTSGNDCSPDAFHLGQ